MISQLALHRGRLIVGIITVLSGLLFGAGQKCGTPQAVSRFNRAKTPLLPPELPLRYESEHFVVHYDTSGSNSVYPVDSDDDNVPDYVESTAVYLEHSWHILIDSLGYRQPIPDTFGLSDSSGHEYGGDERVDIYLDGSLGEDFYGETQPMVQIYDASTETWKATAYIIARPDMTTLRGYENNPYPALAVTCAHEFYHTIQFAYRYPISYEETYFKWWMEATAVFNEELCFNDANDYYSYLHSFQDVPQEPLFEYNPSTWYGAVMFPIFLCEYFSSAERRFSAEVMKEIWELMETTMPQQAVSEFLESRGSSMKEALRTFTLWRTRVDEFFCEDFFAEGQNYPLPDMTELELADEQITISDSLQQLACKFYKLPYNFSDVGIVGELVELEFPADGCLEMIPIELPGSPLTDQFYGTVGEQLAINGIWQYLSLIFAPIVYSYDPMSAAEYTIRICEVDSLSVPLPSENIISNPYPNPCAKTQLTFPIEITAPADVKIKIFSAAGEAVWDTSASYTYPEHSKIYWNRCNYYGKRVSAGIYIFVISAGNSQRKGKLLLINE